MAVVRVRGGKGRRSGRLRRRKRSPQRPDDRPTIPRYDGHSRLVIELDQRVGADEEFAGRVRFQLGANERFVGQESEHRARSAGCRRGNLLTQVSESICPVRRCRGGAANPDEGANRPANPGRGTLIDEGKAPWAEGLDQRVHDVYAGSEADPKPGWACFGFFACQGASPMYGWTVPPRPLAVGQWASPPSPGDRPRFILQGSFWASRSRCCPEPIRSVAPRGWSPPTMSAQLRHRVTHVLVWLGGDQLDDARARVPHLRQGAPDNGEVDCALADRRMVPPGSARV